MFLRICFRVPFCFVSKESCSIFLLKEMQKTSWKILISYYKQKALKSCAWFIIKLFFVTVIVHCFARSVWLDEVNKFLMGTRSYCAKNENRQNKLSDIAYPWFLTISFVSQIGRYFLDGFLIEPNTRWKKCSIQCNGNIKIYLYLL